MIKINLLPPEYRKVEGTPIARLVATVAGVALVTCAAGVWGYVHTAMLAQVREERIQREEELANVKALADRSQALLKEFKEYQRRRETIEKIGASRMLWSRKLDELSDIIHNKGDTKRHLVWLASVRTQQNRIPASPVELVIKGWSGGEQSRKLSDFNSDIKHSEFFEDCIAVDPPEGRRVNLDEDFVPNQGWEFSFGIDLKQPTWRETQQK
jgi:Tfp pilus assembly protein PilN